MNGLTTVYWYAVAVFTILMAQIGSLGSAPGLVACGSYHIHTTCITSQTFCLYSTAAVTQYTTIEVHGL